MTYCSVKVMLTMFNVVKILLLIHAAKGYLNTTSEQYVGCYKDSAPRAMNNGHTTSNQQTIENCIMQCKEKKYRYAGLQYRSQCFCGDSYDKYGQGEGCDLQCSGQNTQICGVCPTGCRDWCSAGDESICDECVPGKYGDKCYYACPQNCSDSMACNQNTSVCLGCDDGNWGEFCNDRCSSTCAKNECDQMTGSCDSCIPGYQSPACESQCGHCMNVSCYQDSGECIMGCEDGYFLPQCNAPCPQNCDTRCEQENGTCSDGCNVGYYGATCTAKCPGNCNSLNCEQTDGKCKDECQSGYHGAWCNKTCDGCAENSCDKSGNCMKGCNPGLTGSSCAEFCPSGRFGLLCNMSCYCADGVSCDPVGGKCPSGCADGWMGIQCAQPLMEEEQNMANIGPIVGGVIAIIFMIVLIITIIVVIKRKSRLKDKEPLQIDLEDPQPDTSHVNPKSNDMADEETDLDEKSVTEDILSEAVKNTPTTDIYENPTAINTECAVDHLTDYIKKTDLAKEYKLLLEGIVHPWTVAQKTENKGKNRYKGIMAYDHSRVILKTSNKSESDYINANYMPGYKRDKVYVASQGPTAQIVNDFWRMVWQTEARIIVMTTNLEENKKMKCEQYWPSEGSINYGAVTVSIQKEIIKHHYIIRVLLIKQGDEEREVHQFHFKDWPDHGVPESTTSILHFRQMVRKQNEGHDKPIVVHCSAGVGRSGTFIALDYLLEEASDQGSVNVARCVNVLRNNRVQIVQKVEQYIFLYHALNDGVNVGCTFVTQKDIVTITDETTENQFKLLQKLVTARGKQNDMSQHVVNFQSDKTFITTPLPQANEVNSFWEMVVDKKSQSVIFCVDTNKKKSTKSCHWLPMLNGALVLTSGLQLSHKPGKEEDYTYVDLTVTQAGQEFANIPEDEQTYMNVQKTGSDYLIRVFTVHDSMPVDKYAEICKEIQKQLEKPIIVAHKSSISQSGLLIASCVVLEDFSLYGEVDVFDTVRRLQQLHPGFLKTLEHFKHLYQLLQLGEYEEISRI